MERAGLTQQLNNLFAALLKDNPECPFWSEYVRVAAHAGHANEALQLVRTTLDRSGLSSRRRRELTNLLPTALLANDEIDEAVTELRHSFTNSSQAATGDDEETQPALRLARIGKLLNRTNWLEEGLAIARKNLTNETGPDSRPNLDTELAQILTEIGRGAEAEEVLAITLRQAIQASQQTQNRFDGMNRSQAASMLVELVKLYHHAGRYEDVLRVLDDSPNWGAPDLLQLDSLSSYSYYRVRGHYIAELPVSYYAAAALAKVGRKAEATKILDHLFEQHAGSDRLYELLLEMDSTNPMAKLESLYAKDRFEERPLIWEAHWLRLQGKLEEAETLARKAISIDPSDGEEGPGDRMRAYAELAEIRAARNDQKEADFFRGVVSAIRESEQADQFQAAGLLKRAVKMYEDALNHFADAYCIQSRLAIQLADLGMHQQAEEHYRRAYELMPDSFGRVESHCFGCERAFEGEKAQNIAEKVFTEIAQKTPQKPQVHYLLGYLRDEQERPKDAAASYRQAVKLDPDYLNAWIKLSQEGSKVFLPESERDEIVFNLIRLDPHQKHGGFDVSHVSDLAGLWNHVAGDPLLREQSKVQSLYPLPASKRKLEEHGNDAARQQAELWQQRMADRENEANTPAQLISQNAFIRAGISLVARTDSGSD
jgi:tetratricopeptide (TPR) repeat protein